MVRGPFGGRPLQVPLATLSKGEFCGLPDDVRDLVEEYQVPLVSTGALVKAVLKELRSACRWQGDSDQRLLWRHTLEDDVGHHHFLQQCFDIEHSVDEQGRASEKHTHRKLGWSLTFVAGNYDPNHNATDANGLPFTYGPLIANHRDWLLV